jgi:hypothetical protein
MIFLVERVTLGQVFLQVLPLSLVVFPPMLHTHLHSNITVTRKTSGKNLGSLKEKSTFRYWRAWSRRVLSHLALEG